MSEINKYTFLVEVIYDQVYVENNGTPEIRHASRIASQVWSFENEDRDAALSAANAAMEKVLIEGLSVAGGSILKSIITPTCIRQVGLVDYNLYQEEQRPAKDESLAQEG